RQDGTPALSGRRCGGKARLPRRGSRHAPDAGGRGGPRRRHGCAGDEPDHPHDRGHRNPRRGDRKVRPGQVKPNHAAISRHMSVVAAALLLLVLALWLGAAVGETAIPLETVARTVANRIWNAGHAVDPLDEGIVWNYRLSRAVVAACCGAALGLSGVVLQ